jgi:hypothetical protein
MTNARDFRFDANSKPRDFSPKFKSRDEICGFFFAGMCRGAMPNLIAAATGVAEKTIVNLLRPKARNYVGIKQEFYQRVEREFGEQYYTVEIAERLIAEHNRINGTGASSSPNTKDARPSPIAGAVRRRRPRGRTAP